MILLLIGLTGSILTALKYTNFLSNSLLEEDLPQKEDVITLVPQYSLTEFDTIFVDGNEIFHELALNESWAGNGSLAAPYLITELNITNSTGSSAIPLIEIRNTDLYFNLSYCLLEGGSYGIFLSNVTNALIHNNTIRNSLGDFTESDGIVLNTCSNNTLFDNMISGHDEYGITLSNSKNNTIHSNDLIDNGDGGIGLTSSDNNTLSSNNVFSSGRFAILLTSSSDNNTVSDNTIIDHGYSIYVSSNSQHNRFIRNIIDQNGEFGIRLTDSSNNTIQSNWLLADGMGMFIDSSPANIFKDNEITNFGIRVIGDNLGHLLQTSVINNTVNNKPVVYWKNINGGTVPLGAGQIILVNCTDVTIYNQEISNLEVAIALDYSNRVLIENNSIVNSSFNGILLRYSNFSTIVDNYIVNTDGEGLVIAYSENNSIVHNSLINSSMMGCTIGYSSNNTFNSNNISFNIYGCYILSSKNTSFSYNIFNNNTEYAIYLFSSEHSFLDRNDFLFNKQTGGSQAYDSQTNPLLKNTFEYNHWNDWTEPDNNSDRIVDQPYSIDGPANNQDSYPLSVPYSKYVHTITEPTILYPNGGETVSNIVIINWTSSIDSWDHNASYSLYYSNDNGSSWILLQANQSMTSYEWDTNTVADGSEFLVKVVVICTEGLISSDYSDNVFSVENQIHTLSIPVIIYPNGGEIVSGEISIQWVEALDTWGHSVNYSLYYSSNSGFNWILIESNLTSNNYNWNIDSLNEGSTYLIKVVAICTDGLTVVDISNDVFTITTVPHDLTNPVITSPNGGEILNGTIQIQWNASEDSLNHLVTYSIYFSFDNGITWFELVSNLTSNTYTWNTSIVADGSNYLIKVKAICLEGLISEDISDGVFTVQNIISNTTTPTTTTAPTTTTSTTTSDTTSTSEDTTTTTISEDGSFPSIIFVAIFITCFVIAIRKFKKN
jgi:parallel beta-helix repeat protein